jgi:hypothetical protein
VAEDRQIDGYDPDRVIFQVPASAIKSIDGKVYIESKGFRVLRSEGVTTIRAMAQGELEEFARGKPGRSYQRRRLQGADRCERRPLEM